MEISEVLDALYQHKISAKEAESYLKRLPFEDIGYAMVDHHRRLRTGAPEVIYGAGKTAAQITGIIETLRSGEARNILITRCDETKFNAIKALFPEAAFDVGSGIVMTEPPPPPRYNGEILVICAGTSDIYAAEEAALTAEYLAHPVRRIYDAGVAGLHRLLSHLEDIQSASVIVAAAGMEGALPGVVAGLTSAPVIALPTSVGYGTGLGGVSALMSMLNSCAAGISVVNIDNGFGAGYMAAAINRLGGSATGSIGRTAGGGSKPPKGNDEK